jgi:hypothetical protein
MRKNVVIYEVLYHADNCPYGGAMGDGSFIARFASEAKAKEFARGHHYYGRPAQVQRAEVSYSAAWRYGCV